MWKKTAATGCDPAGWLSDTGCCDCVGQEALSVVSEDQPIFEPPYTAAPAMHMKTEMTSPGGFSQTSKQSPEPAEPEWVGSVTQNSGKRGEHVNGTRWVRTGWGSGERRFPDYLTGVFSQCGNFQVRYQMQLFVLVSKRKFCLHGAKFWRITYFVIINKPRFMVHQVNSQTEELLFQEKSQNADFTLRALTSFSQNFNKKYIRPESFFFYQWL